MTTSVDPEDHDQTRMLQPSAEGDEDLLLGRYSLHRQLGHGAFGTVWLARDVRLDRDVAVKSLPRERVIHQRFEREARAAARLHHPAIVTLYEAAVDDDGAYLVSELVRGKTLDAQLNAGKLSDRDIVEVGVALTDALIHAHEQGVIHRDVKPSNVLVPNRATTAAGRAKLTDFGVAHVVGSGTLTRAGDVVGTLAYMAPEQARGEEALAASDLYSVAVVLYEALCGVNPLAERTPYGHGARNTPFVPPLRRQRRDLPRALADAIDRALSLRLQDRGSLQDLQQALRLSISAVDDTAGVVSPAWHGHEQPTQIADAGPGPEWRQQPADGGTRMRPGSQDPQEPRSGALRRPWGAAGLRAGGDTAGWPAWLPRAVSAAAAGLLAALISTHLLKHPPLAQAADGLIVAAAVLLFPRLGTLGAVVVAAALAVLQGRTGGGLLLAAVALGPILALWWQGEVLALPALAPLLGLIGLAGAWPAIAGRSIFTWYQRAVLGGAGFLWTLYASLLAGRSLYWWPGPDAAIPPQHQWIGSAHATYYVVIQPFLHASGLIAIAIWALAAAVLPLLRTGRWPMLDILLAGVWSAAVVGALGAVGAHDLHGAALGAVVGFLVAAGPALVTLARSGDARMGEPARAV